MLIFRVKQSLREGWDEAERGVEKAKRLENFKLKDGARDGIVEVWGKNNEINLYVLGAFVLYFCSAILRSFPRGAHEAS